MYLTCALEVAIPVIWFFLANLIGSRANCRGYMPMTVTPEIDENPLFNLLYKVSTPVIFMVLTMALSEKAGIRSLLPKAWVMVIFYFCIRYLFVIFIQGRIKLANWVENFLVASVSVGLAWYIYETIIIEKDYFFPTKRDLSNAMWLGVIGFLYKIFNAIRLPHDGTEKRKNKYIEKMYLKIRDKYGSAVNKETQEPRLKRLIYSIAIIENFNRPYIYREIERILFRFGMAHTLGILQVKTDRLITDYESVEIGSRKIVKDYCEEVEKSAGEENIDHVVRSTVMKYNGSFSYADDVGYVYDYIEELEK